MNLRRAEIAIAWIAAVPFAVWTVIRLFGLDSGYPLEAMMPFTPYVAALSVAAVALALALRCRSAATSPRSASPPSSCRASSRPKRSAPKATKR